MYLHDKGVENLIIGIVTDACKELSTAYGRVHRRELRGLEAKTEDLTVIKIMEAWFRGPDFEFMCDLDPEFLIDTCKRLGESARRINISFGKPNI